LRVARNRCIDLIRRRRTVAWEEGETDEPIDAEPLPDELVERADLQHLLAEAIQQLPPAYGEVVALRYAAERSFGEIAAIVGCDEGTARVRFLRAKTRLREYLRTRLEAEC
jgi:RNA polymerase sigma-70 factor (ECF subfamily)